MTRAGRWLLVLSGLFGSSCHSTRIGPPPSAPSIVRPLDAMPADLDLVLRIDLKKMRDTLGAPAMTVISEQALSGLRGADQATDALLLSALDQTDTLWIGVRLTPALQAADSVLVLSGQFANFDPHRAASTPPFDAGIDLGGTMRRFERKKPPARSAPARIYVQGEDLIVSVSETEIDSVERSLEEQRGAPPLEPADKGALSAVARPRVLPRELFAGSDSVRRLAQSADRLELNADLTGSGVDATLALKFEDAPLAERVAQALTEMRDALGAGSGRLAKFALRLKLGNAGQYVSLRLVLGRDELSELVNCRGSACAW